MEAVFQNDYRRLPRSSGDGMESYTLSSDVDANKSSKNVFTASEVKLQNSMIPSGSDHRNHFQVSKLSSAEVFGVVNGEGYGQSLNSLNKHSEFNENTGHRVDIEGKIFDQVSSIENSCKFQNQVSDLGGPNPVVSSRSLERAAECLDLQALVKDLETQNQQLSNENEKLLKKLSVQSKVNADLKKLLVASVGEDIGARLEEMTTDKAQFNSTIRNLEKELEETSEELGKVSIECDVWRTKFLASRMMTNGLTDMKSSLFVQNRHCYAALQGLLEEQSDIRQHLRATNRLLQGIHKKTNTTTHQTKKTSQQNFERSSIVELSHVNFSLAADICQVVDPNHFYGTVSMSSVDEEIIPVRQLTPAEQMACQVLKNNTNDVEDVRFTIKNMERQYIGNSYASRFLTNNFRITFDCCERCTGKLEVV